MAVFLVIAPRFCSLSRAGFISRQSGAVLEANKEQVDGFRAEEEVCTETTVSHTFFQLLSFSLTTILFVSLEDRKRERKVADEGIQTDECITPARPGHITQEAEKEFWGKNIEFLRQGMFADNKKNTLSCSASLYETCVSPVEIHGRPVKHPCRFIVTVGSKTPLGLHVHRDHRCDPLRRSASQRVFMLVEH